MLNQNQIFSNIATACIASVSSYPDEILRPMSNLGACTLGNKT